MKKFLIYAACIFGYGFINAAFMAAGISLGGIPTAALVLATFALARFLCKKYCPPKPMDEDDDVDEGEDGKI